MCGGVGEPVGMMSVMGWIGFGTVDMSTEELPFLGLAGVDSRLPHNRIVISSGGQSPSPRPQSYAWNHLDSIPAQTLNTSSKQ